MNTVETPPREARGNEKATMSYTDAFPGRFLSADHFKGKKVTLTVADVYLEPIDKKKKPALIMKFVESKLELCLPKTNAYCIKMMFTYKLEDWLGKRITFYPSTCRFGPAMVDCIRVWGSPDIPEDMTLSVPQGRNSPLTMTMHAIKGGAPKQSGDVKSTARPENNSAPETNQQQSRAPLAEPDAAIVEAWSALGWSREQGQTDWGQYRPTDGTISGYLAHLSALIDQENAKEGTF
jgi:hypothetical protein